VTSKSQIGWMIFFVTMLRHCMVLTLSFNHNLKLMNHVMGNHLASILHSLVSTLYFIWVNRTSWVSIKSSHWLVKFLFLKLFLILAYYPFLKPQVPIHCGSKLVQRLGLVTMLSIVANTIAIV
jgi:hypothetical protein